jgi:hypothetical protein
MRYSTMMWALGLGLFAAGVSGAQDPALFGRAKPAGSAGLYVNVGELQLIQAGETKEKDKEPDKGKGPPPRPPEDEFASAPAPGGEAPVGLNPNMIGDVPPFFSLRTILLPTMQSTTTFQTVVVGTRTVTFIGPTGQPIQIQVPVTARVPVVTTTTTTIPVTTRVPLGFGGGSLKVGENQSPMPSDRAFVTFNYYNGLRAPADSSTAPRVNTVTTVINGVPATVSTLIPGPPTTNLFNQMAGFEKTFLDGGASIGMRLPFAQLNGDGSVGQQDIGDMSWLFNYAFYRDTTTGNVLSAGVMATLPTGPPQYTNGGNIHPTLVQPFLGYRWSVDRFYVQGFTSSALPTDPRFVTGLFNDVGAGYWLYRSASRSDFISAIVPTVEAHVTTPLNHRSPDSLISVPDIVALTSGVHIFFANRALLTVGVTTPVTGPRVFPVEAVAQFNFRY